MLSDQLHVLLLVVSLIPAAVSEFSIRLLVLLPQPFYNLSLCLDFLPQVVVLLLLIKQYLLLTLLFF